MDDGITGPEVVVLNSAGNRFLDESGQDLCLGRDHAAPRLLGRTSDFAVYVVDDGADPFGRAGESVWRFSSNEPPFWLETFKVDSVRQPRNDIEDSLYFVGQRWGEPEIGLFRLLWWNPIHVERLGELGDPAVAEPLPEQVYAVTPWMVCYRGLNGSQPMIRAFRFDDPGNVLSYPLGPVMDPWITSNGHDRICYAGYDPGTGIEPWMIVDDFRSAPLIPELLVDSNPSTSTTVAASRFVMQGDTLYFETGANSRLLKFVDTHATNHVAHTIFADSEFISKRQPVSWNKLAFVYKQGNSDYLLLYDTTSRTSQSLGQNVKVRDLWAPDGGLNAIIEDDWRDTLYRLVNSSWSQVRSFPPKSARPVKVNGAENSSTGWVIGTVSNLPRLHKYPVALSGSVSLLSMIYEGYSTNASSHPADFYDLGGHLFLTANQNGLRVLFHSPDGAQDSLQPVMLGERYLPTTPFAALELVKLGDQLFARAAANGTLHVVTSDAADDPLYSDKVWERTPDLQGVLCERLTVAAGKVFFVQVEATTETLRYVNPDLSLGTVQVFQKPSEGQAITQMTGTPDRLFFTASTNPNLSTTRQALWNTTGSGMLEQRMLPSHYDSPRILGIWGGQCVFWSAGGNGRFDMFTWSGLAGDGPQYRGDDDIERRPELSRTPGFPSGIEFDGRFVYCTRAGLLIVLGTSGGVEDIWWDSSKFVRPEFISILNGKPVWKAYGQRSLPTGMLESNWFQWSAATGATLIDSIGGEPGPLRTFAGRVWSTSGFGEQTSLTFWNGLEEPLQWLPEPVDPYQAVGDVSMGTYRGRLVLSSKNHPFADRGYEPTLLLENSAPAAPVPLKRTGARPGQPFVFTYEDIQTWGITDAEGDPFSLEVSALLNGSLKVNGSAVSVSSHVPLHPGDTLEWTPPTGPVGDIEAFQMHAADSWDGLYFPVTIRIETPHEEWTRQHFTTEQLADPLVSGPEADADGDGVSNALEFLFGRLPHQREGERGWSLSSTTPAAGQRRAVFTFNRLAVLPQGTTVRIEQSGDLQSWTSVAQKLQNAAWTFPVAGVSVEEVPLLDGRIETRVAVEESASINRFLRLRLVLP
ncbi:MAG: hypothetical protein IPK22_20500 [Verrucomicrobiaceae bacterium]|nr:hypothetical protein [Verrucomicrobiaceae bacterium]